VNKKFALLESYHCQVSKITTIDLFILQERPIVAPIAYAQDKITGGGL